MKVSIFVCAGLLALSLGGCAATQDGLKPYAPKRTSMALPTNECIFIRGIRNYRPLDEYNLLIWGANRNKPYLLEFTTRCSGLSFSSEIGIADRTTDGRLCSFGRDAVLVRDAGTVRRCSISAIRTMNSEEVGLISEEFKRGHEEQETEPSEEVEPVS